VALAGSRLPWPLTTSAPSSQKRPVSLLGLHAWGCRPGAVAQLRARLLVESVGGHVV